MRIDEHVAIGDGRSVALTDGWGAIDWLCWPRFDSDPIFDAILDPVRGGAFRITPHGARRASARYIEDTNVAFTSFELDGGTLELVDAMAVDLDGAHERTLSAEHEIVRMVSARRVDAVIDVSIRPSRAFRRKVLPRGTVRFEDRGSLITLRASRPLTWHEEPDRSLSCTFTLRAGETIGFSLAFAADAPLVLSPLFDAGRSVVAATVETWRTWAKKARYDGPHRDAVVRSALALKLLCYTPSGAIIAAPTTSLPEARGGDRNWDYRFCWLRDAALTARALFGLGYEAEADAFTSWLLHATRLTRPELRVLYDVYGEQPRAEREVYALAGYGGAQPIRIGNAAAEQLQLDLYGEVIDAVAQAWSHGREPDRAEVDLLLDLGDFVVANWRRPDSGIWEPRGEPEHNVHSRVLCWVALDRLLEHADMLRLDGERRHELERQRALIASEVRERGWSPKRSSYVSTIDGDRLDACLLLLSWYGFEEPSSERMKSTFAAIDRELGIGRHLLRRYDGVEDDGGFVACAFWAAEHLARGGGSLADARARFGSFLELAPPSGLYAEIVDVNGEHLGNYPQGFSHLALLNCALSLEEREKVG